MNGRVLLAVAAVFAVYFPVAVYFKLTYEPGQTLPPAYYLPYPPFPKFGQQADSKAYVAWLHPEFAPYADSNQDQERSPLIVLEDGKPIGRAHAAHADIEKLGGGLFSHWSGVGLIFSTSDNSDPTTNGRLYSVQPNLRSRKPAQ